MARGGARANSGGARIGAGRPRGSKTKISRPHAERVLAADGIMPVQVMLCTMRWHFAAQRFDEAARVASLVAGYVRPRLATTTLTVRPAISEMTDEELVAAAEEADSAADLAEKLRRGMPPGTTTKH